MGGFILPRSEPRFPQPLFIHQTHDYDVLLLLQKGCVFLHRFSVHTHLVSLLHVNPSAKSDGTSVVPDTIHTSITVTSRLDTYMSSGLSLTGETSFIVRCIVVASTPRPRCAATKAQAN